MGDPFAEGSRRLSLLLTPKRKATQFAIVNPVHCRLSPTQPFSKRLPTLDITYFTFTLIPCEQLL
ncbi:MAG: hypothetical protein LBK82_01060 [Planctomycetaceae bacterium]|nr:hypothetical protein [Planctomycetaceae bacterium]